MLADAIVSMLELFFAIEAEAGHEYVHPIAPPSTCPPEEGERQSGAWGLGTRRGYVGAALLLELVDRSFQGLDSLSHGLDEGLEIS